LPGISHLSATTGAGGSIRQSLEQSLLLEGLLIGLHQRVGRAQEKIDQQSGEIQDADENSGQDHDQAVVRPRLNVPHCPKDEAGPQGNQEGRRQGEHNDEQGRRKRRRD